VSELQYWGIHGGRTGDAHSLFLKEKVVALGWSAVGDLSKLAPNRKAFKSAVAANYPDKKAGAIPVDAGQLFRFVHEAKAGDMVVYPSKTDRRIHIARIIGPYVYAPTDEFTYPHRRRVDWLTDVPRTRFSQGALYEIGSSMSFFTVKTYADEFRAVLEGKSAPTPVAEDESVAAIAEEIEEQTRDIF
jgi:restriction system protein